MKASTKHPDATDNSAMQGVLHDLPGDAQLATKRERPRPGQSGVGEGERGRDTEALLSVDTTGSPFGLAACDRQCRLLCCASFISRLCVLAISSSLTAPSRGGIFALPAVLLYEYCNVKRWRRPVVDVMMAHRCLAPLEKTWRETFWKTNTALCYSQGVIPVEQGQPAFLSGRQRVLAPLTGSLLFIIVGEGCRREGSARISQQVPGNMASAPLPWRRLNSAVSNRLDSHWESVP